MMSEDTYKVSVLRMSNPAETAFVRLKPFLLAKARIHMAKIVAKHPGHTDSIVSDIPIDFENTGKMGMFKYEGVCQSGYVKNHNEKSPNDAFII